MITFAVHDRHRNFFCGVQPPSFDVTLPPLRCDSIGQSCNFSTTRRFKIQYAGLLLYGCYESLDLALHCSNVRSYVLINYLIICELSIKYIFVCFFTSTNDDLAVF
jgi:hypothetical protein